MSTTDQMNDLFITFVPEATEEEKERFLAELARAIIAIARHLVAQEKPSEDLKTIEF